MCSDRSHQCSVTRRNFPLVFNMTQLLAMDTYNMPSKQSKRPAVLTALGAIVVVFFFWISFLKPEQQLMVTKVRNSGLRRSRALTKIVMAGCCRTEGRLTGDWFGHLRATLQKRAGNGDGGTEELGSPCQTRISHSVSTLMTIFYPA